MNWKLYKTHYYILILIMILLIGGTGYFIFPNQVKSPAIDTLTTSEIKPVVVTDFPPSNHEGNVQAAKPFQSLTSSIPAGPTAKQIPVLMYHHLLKADENTNSRNPVTIAVEVFEQQMKFLYENGYYTATLDELERYIHHKLNLPEKTVVITFDDGYKSNYIYAYPILKKYNFKASIFVITEKLSNPLEEFTPSRLVYFTASELPPMLDVFTIDSHTNNLHGLRNGKGLIQVLSDEVVLEDLRYSRTILKTDYLAYPIGRYDERVISLVKEAGYRLAFTTDEGPVKPGDNPYALQRVFVDSRFSFERFKQLVLPPAHQD